MNICIIYVVRGPVLLSALSVVSSYCSLDFSDHDSNHTVRRLRHVLYLVSNLYCFTSISVRGMVM